MKPDVTSDRPAVWFALAAIILATAAASIAWAYTAWPVAFCTFMFVFFFVFALVQFAVRATLIALDDELRFCYKAAQAAKDRTRAWWAANRVTHGQNNRMLLTLEMLLPPKMRSDAMATIKDDIKRMKAAKWKPRRIRRYIIWQLLMAISPAIYRLIRRTALWGAFVVAGKWLLSRLGF